MVPSHQSAATLALLLVPKEMLPAVRIRILAPTQGGWGSGTRVSPTPGAPPSPRILPGSSASCGLHAGYRGRCSPPTPSPPLLQAHRLNSQSTNAPSCRLFPARSRGGGGHRQTLIFEENAGQRSKYGGMETGIKGSGLCQESYPKRIFQQSGCLGHSLGIPPLHHYLLSLFMGDHLLHTPIPRVLRLQTASVPLGRASSQCQ